VDLNPVDHIWPVLNRMMKGHTVVYRATKGVIGHRVPFGPPMLLLDHVGAKSGVKRTSPLVYVKDRGDVAVIASKGVNPQHPAWYHNLRANPEGKVCVKEDTRAFRAVEADGERRDRIWQEALKVYPGFETYEQRASHRRIAVWVLEPKQ